MARAAQRPPKAKTKNPAASRADDPRFVALLEALASDPRFTDIVNDFAMSAAADHRTFGTVALKVRGKIFAMMAQSTLVVKLPRTRVAAIVAAGDGAQLELGPGRLMKEWIAITSDRLSWVELAREAHAFVGAIPQGRG